MTRRALLTVAGAMTAGCLAGPTPGDTPTSGPSTDQPSTDRSPTAERPATGITPGVNQPPSDHAVVLSNRGTGERRVRVRVTRAATGEAVFDETLTVASDSEREVYNLAKADPDGIEVFEVCGQLADPTPARTMTGSGAGSPDSPARSCVTIETDACYGSAHLDVRDGGELRAFYSIC